MPTLRSPDPSLHEPPSAEGPSGPSFWPLHAAGWAALAVAMWLGSVTAGADTLESLADKALFASTGALLTLGLRPFYRRLYRRRVSVALLVTVIAACSYALSLLWSASYKIGVEVIDLLWLGEPIPSLSVPYLLFDMSLFYSFIFVSWSVLYVGIRHTQDAQDARERALVAESLAHQAQLEALRYQLNPHFLFNTLNALSTLIAEEQTRDARRMVARLADFLRLTLERGSAAEVALAEELDFVRRYLDVERVRFGDRLQTQIDADPEALGARVPPLLLQPLVENAVRHGVVSREDGGTVRIEIRRAGDAVVLLVEDDGAGPPPDGAGQTGVGLANVRARLHASYGAAGSLRLLRLDGGGCQARIDLPFQAADPLPSSGDASTVELARL